jgi:hypothetical protein
VQISKTERLNDAEPFVSISGRERIKTICNFLGGALIKVAVITRVASSVETTRLQPSNLTQCTATAKYVAASFDRQV